ncbi:MAG TPA: hypothetical protein DHV36_00035 [Desulfobacteraceae bacterium]|nr:hypothetical protein [Desulfobacteraceae bacterium]|tara:strand:- start:1363 stop:2430 length:1068 start_codon:yes stop_codon:yes gene_type:complete
MTKRAKTMLRCLLAFAVVLMLSAAGTMQALADSPRVFILHSYEAGHVCGQPQADGVLAALDAAGFTPGQTLTVAEWFMDTKRKYVTPEAVANQAKIALDRIREFKPDLLVTIDDTAFKHVGLTLVDTDVAVIFSGMNNQPENYHRLVPVFESRAHPRHNVTGVYELLHINDAIRVHGKIFNKTSKTQVIVDRDSPTGKAIRRQAELELDGMPKTLWDIAVVGSVAEYRAVLEAANRDDSIGAIYPVALVLKDHKGEIWDAARIFKLTLDVSRKPELALNYAFCKMGLFGGAAVDFRAMGYQAGIKAAAVLNGTDPGTIPLEDARDYALAFNLKRARQLNINIPEEILAASDDIFF